LPVVHTLYELADPRAGVGNVTIFSSINLFLLQCPHEALGLCVRDIKPSRTETTYNGEYDPAYLVEDGELLVGMDGEFNSTLWSGGPALLNQRVCKLHSFENVLKEYVARLLPVKLKETEDATYAVTVKHISAKQIKALEIPLPPLEVQREIVAEIEGYQKVIDGARSVIENYRPHIPIDPASPVTSLGNLASFKNGLNFTKDEAGHAIAIVGVGDFQNNLTVPVGRLSNVMIADKISDEYLLHGGDILFVRSNGNPDLVGRSMLVPDGIGRATFSGFTIRARMTSQETSSRYLTHFFKSADFAGKMKTVGQGASIRNLSQGILDGLQIPLPPLEIQQAIVAEIEAEQALVNANRELITRFEKKIEATMARVWGAAETTA
jgi:type I restriction enzyme M protein